MARPSKESNFCHCNYRPKYLPPHMVSWQSQKFQISILYLCSLIESHPNILTIGILFRFHPGVNRCYCPSKEVVKRALYDGLEESQIQVFGLPIRPSFARAVLSKVRIVDIKELICMLALVGGSSDFCYAFFFLGFVGWLKRRAWDGSWFACGSANGRGWRNGPC